MAKGINAKKKEVEFSIPSFFSSDQLFGADDENRIVVFVKSGQRITKSCLSPKNKAFDLSNKINGQGTKGGVVRLTFKGKAYLAYVVIDLSNSQQTKWAKTQKEKRQLIEEKFTGELVNDEISEQVLYA